MAHVDRILGIPFDALPAWLALSAALDRLADEGRVPVCAQRPSQWDQDAKPAARRDAAEACGYCPALHPCAAYADMAKEKHGVWGGIDRSYRPGKRTADAA